MKQKILLYGILFGIIFFCTWSCRKAGLLLVKSDELVESDAMIVLMGSIPDRALQAADLYQQRMTEIVLIVEGISKAFKELEARGVELISGTQQMHKALVDLGVDDESIKVLKGNSQSTLHEAQIVREFLSNNPSIDTLILVSSAPHMRRAHMIFKDVLINSNDPVHIMCSPSSYSDFNAEKWWRSKDDIEIVMMEYLKLMNYIVIERYSKEQVINRE